jgi:DNA-directed RNA polymerase specialized sigma24 family protein
MEAQVRAAQRGDPVAMDILLTDLAPWVGRICAAIALEQGEDALQETLIVVLRNLPALRDPAAWRAWVRRIAVRESLRMVRDNREVTMRSSRGDGEQRSGHRPRRPGHPA